MCMESTVLDLSILIQCLIKHLGCHNIFYHRYYCLGFCLNLNFIFLGYTITIFKRRRMFPHINHHSAQMRAQAARQAVNFCIQGGCFREIMYKKRSVLLACVLQPNYCLWMLWLSCGCFNVMIMAKCLGKNKQ